MYSQLWFAELCKMGALHKDQIFEYDTNLNCICKETELIKFVEYLCHSVETLLFSHVMSKTIKTEVYRMIIPACFVLVWNLVSHIKGVL